MHASTPARSPRRWIRLVTAALAAFTLVATACSSDSDSTASRETIAADAADGADDATTEPVVEPADTVAGEDDSADPAVTDTTAEFDAGSGDDTAECGSLTAAEIAAAVGAGNFDTADDVSVDTDQTCVFGNATSVSGVTVTTQLTTDYLDGDLDGVPVEDALTSLETANTLFLDDGATVERTTVAGVPAVVITGTDSIQGAPIGVAATVADGVVIQVSASGTELAADPSDFGPIVSAVLELAVAAQE